MKARSVFFCGLLLLLATTATAQGPIFDPDDFLDPHQHEGLVFTSRLVLGGAAGFIDQYRPTHQSAPFLHVTGSVYGPRFQFDYKHSDVRGDREPVAVCPCQPPVYFPTPPPRGDTPAAPPPGPRETVQLGFYAPAPGVPADEQVMVRYRFSWTRQPIATTVRYLNTDQVATRLSGDEQTFGLDADTYFHIGSHLMQGSVFLTRTLRASTTDPRNQTAFIWTNRFPPIVGRGVFLRAALAVGGISGRGATGLNLVSPTFEAFWHNEYTRANVHLVWNPQMTRSGLEGWRTHHQIAMFVDRSLFLKLMGRK